MPFPSPLARQLGNMAVKHPCAPALIHDVAPQAHGCLADVPTLCGVGVCAIFFEVSYQFSDYGVRGGAFVCLVVKANA